MQRSAPSSVTSDRQARRKGGASDGAALSHGDAGGAIDYLVESQRPVTEMLRQFDDVALDEMRPTHFGVDWPARRVFAVLIDEQVHHGAEIALLRDLYRDRA